MRELVYLSERKLRQFRAPARRRFSIREITIPGLGQVGVDQQGGSHLDAVVAHLDGLARWYTEDVRVGQWVHFEARLAHRVVRTASGLRVLLFAEPAEHAGTPRLVLHGAPEHLLGAEPVPAQERWGDGEPTLPPGGSYGEAVRPLMWHLATAAAAGTTTTGDHGDELTGLVTYLDRELDASTSAWMAGYARVTVDAGRLPIVVASPLFVEFVPAPDGQ